MGPMERCQEIASRGKFPVMRNAGYVVGETAYPWRGTRHYAGYGRCYCIGTDRITPEEWGEIRASQEAHAEEAAERSRNARARHEWRRHAEELAYIAERAAKSCAQARVRYAHDPSARKDAIDDIRRQEAAAVESKNKVHTLAMSSIWRS